MKFEALQIHTAPEVVVEQIIQSVNSGDLAPGDRMPSQRKLARMFNVGMGTVREAVKTLSAMGYLEISRGKGMFITTDVLSRDQASSALSKALEAVSLAELMKAREMVECSVVKIAAEVADEEQVSRLQAVLNNLRERSQSNETFYPVDFEFHLALAEATNNSIIYEMDKMLVDKAHHYIEFMALSLRTFEVFNIQRAVETAQEIVDAIRTRDGERAARAMSVHLNIVNFELEKEFLPPSGRKKRLG